MLSNTVAFVFVWIFATAGVSKLRPSHQGFYLQTLGQLGRYFSWSNKALVYALGLLELALAIALLLPPLQYWGLVATFGLLVAYTLYIFVNLTRGNSGLPCGCSGPDSAMTLSTAVLVRNLFLCCIALLACYFSTRAELGYTAHALCLTAAMIQIFMYESVNQLIASGDKIKQLKNAWHH